MKKISYEGYGWGDKEAIEYAKVLKSDNCTTVLDLSGNKIGSEGASAILASLEGNNTLKYLNLSGNSISDAKIGAIFGSLSKTVICEADFSGNEITDEAVTLIITSFKEGSVIRTINLSNNSMTKSGMTKVEEALVAALPKFQVSEQVQVNDQDSDGEWVELCREKEQDLDEEWVELCKDEGSGEDNTQLSGDVLPTSVGKVDSIELS